MPRSREPDFTSVPEALEAISKIPAGTRFSFHWYGEYGYLNVGSTSYQRKTTPTT